MLEAFKPAPSAPGPEQAPEWEDTEQPEAATASALGMALAELRALRTPVPTVPAGMSPITGKMPRVGDGVDDISVTRPIGLVDPSDVSDDEPPPPKKRAQTGEGDGPPARLEG